jgi:hypothetical protein
MAPLSEILPRLVNLARSPLRDLRLLLPNGMAGFEPTVRSLLGLLGIKADLIFVDEQQVTSVGNLFYIGPASDQMPRTETQSATRLHTIRVGIFGPIARIRSRGFIQL